jgi:hypothetical protein
VLPHFFMVVTSPLIIVWARERIVRMNFGNDARAVDVQSGGLPRNFEIVVYAEFSIMAMYCRRPKPRRRARTKGSGLCQCERQADQRYSLRSDSVEFEFSFEREIAY